MGVFARVSVIDTLALKRHFILGTISSRAALSQLLCSAFRPIASHEQWCIVYKSVDIRCIPCHYSRAKRASAEVVYNVNQTMGVIGDFGCMQDIIPLLARRTRRATIGYIVYNDFGVLLKGGL